MMCRAVVPYLSEYMDTATAKKVAQDFLDQSFHGDPEQGEGGH